MSAISAVSYQTQSPLTTLQSELSSMVSAGAMSSSDQSASEFGAQ